MIGIGTSLASELFGTQWDLSTPKVQKYTKANMEFYDYHSTIPRNSITRNAEHVY